MKARLPCVLAPATGLALSISVVVGAGTAVADDLCGEAAWFDGSGLTASGELNEPGTRTAAHPSLPFGTRVEVDNLGNGRSAVVRVNDRASFAKGRVILVSRAAAEELGMLHDGTAEVRLTLVDDDGSRAGDCGDGVAQEPATTPLPLPNKLAKSESADDDEIAVAEPVEQGSAPSDPGPIAEDADPDETLLVRFEVAFQPESWQEAELSKAIAAFAPRITAPQRSQHAPASTTRRVKSGLRQIGLSPTVLAYLWSTEVSMPHLARFEHGPARGRVSQLTR